MYFLKRSLLVNFTSIWLGFVTNMKSKNMISAFRYSQKYVYTAVNTASQLLI